jgi:transcriptional regulator with XRE-family HTH domain
MVVRIRRGAKAHLYIKEHMEAKGLSDAKVANRLDVAAVTVWRWRKHQRHLNDPKMRALAYAIGVEPEDLYRLPGRESIDAKLKDAPQEVYEIVRDLAIRLVKTAS